MNPKAAGRGWAWVRAELGGEGPGEFLSSLWVASTAALAAFLWSLDPSLPLLLYPGSLPQALTRHEPPPSLWGKTSCAVLPTEVPDGLMGGG